MPSEDTIQRIFEKLDTLKDVISGVQTDVAVIKAKQESHYQLNDQEHQNMIAMITDTKVKVDGVSSEIVSLKEGHDEQQSELDTERGKRQLLDKIVEYGIMLLSGGLLVAAGGWLAKKIGIF